MADGLFILAHKVNMELDDTKRVPVPLNQPRSRVLVIEGPTAVVNPLSLIRLFSIFQYDLVEAAVDWEHDGKSSMRWEFGSYKNQAEQALFALKKKQTSFNLYSQEPDMWRNVSVSFGRDPCS